MFTLHDLYQLMVQIILNTSGDAPEPWLMASIAMKESNGNPFAHNHNTNGSIDRGLWQINSVHAEEFTDINKAAGSFLLACYNPHYNAMLAVEIWKKQKYTAWSTYVSVLRN